MLIFRFLFIVVKYVCMCAYACECVTVNHCGSGGGRQNSNFPYNECLKSLDPVVIVQVTLAESQWFNME